MLEKMPKHKGGRPPENPSQDVTGFPIPYEELGIKRQIAQRWQAEARVPDQHYHAYLADCTVRYARSTLAVIGQQLRQPPPVGFGQGQQPFRQPYQVC